MDPRCAHILYTEKEENAKLKHNLDQTQKYTLNIIKIYSVDFVKVISRPGCYTLRSQLLQIPTWRWKMALENAAC